jgi:hypothetical protein
MNKKPFEPLTLVPDGYDDYKKEFYKLCTPDYTRYWIEKIKIIRTWIK